MKNELASTFVKLAKACLCFNFLINIAETAGKHNLFLFSVIFIKEFIFLATKDN